MKAKIILIVILLVTVAGCASRTTVKTVRVLENEHTDRKVVIVTKRPAKKRKCWTHAGHWHCRRR